MVFKRPLVKRLLLAAICFAAAVAGFYLFENWRGARALEREVAKLRSAGEALTMEELMPLEVPPEENFCEIEPLRGLADSANEDVRNRLEAASLYIANPVGGSVRPLPPRALDEPIDFLAWRDYWESNGALTFSRKTQEPARDIIEAWDTSHGRFFRDLEGGVNRPHAVLRPSLAARMKHVPPMELPSPHLTPLLHLASALVARTLLLLEIGEADRAVATLRTLGRVRDVAAANEATLLGGLVVIAMDGVTRKALQRAAFEKALSAEQWRSISASLLAPNFREDALRFWRGERVFGVEAIRYIRTHRRALIDAIEHAERANQAASGGVVETESLWQRSKHRLMKVLGQIAPTGWYDQNAATILHWHAECHIDPLLKKDWAAALRIHRNFESTVLAAKRSWWPYRFLTASGFEGFKYAPAKFALASVTLDTTRCAIALEQYHLAHNHYPQTLEALVPEFLPAIPRDLDDALLRYRLTPENGRYLIYSVGPDQVDNRGAVGKRQLDPLLPGKPGDDAAWRYP